MKFRLAFFIGLLFLVTACQAVGTTQTSSVSYSSEAGISDSEYVVDEENSVDEQPPDEENPSDEEGPPGENEVSDEPQVDIPLPDIPSPGAPTGPCSNATEKLFAVCEIVNIERAQVGSEPLTISMDLNAVAEAHAADMLARDYFSHTNPDGLSPFDRLRAANISYQRAAENIAYGHRTAEQVMDSWMTSQGHRTNILSRSYKKLGLGYSGGYWVQVFTD